MSSVWQQAWDAAQPRLHSIQDALASPEFPRPNPRIIRVGQLDAELLDAELVHILTEPVSKALATVNASMKARLEPELALLVQLVLYRFSVWSSGASYGAMLQGLRYSVPSSSLGSSSRPPRRLLIMHGALTILVPYFRNRLNAYALSRAWPDAPASDTRRRAWSALTSLESAHGALSLLNFVAFLWNGRYRTIVDRLLAMRLEPSQALLKRDVSYEFMNRQMVWHAFTEFLLFLLPLVNSRSVARRLTSALSSILPAPSRSQKIRTPKRGKYYALPPDQCAICAENAALNVNLSDAAGALASYTPAFPASSNNDAGENNIEEDGEPPYPITTPYLASCGHIYCYACLAERMLRAADDGSCGWTCLRCAEEVRSADRYRLEGEHGNLRRSSVLSGAESEGVGEGERERSDAGSSQGDEGSEFEFSSEFGSGTGSLGSYTFTGSEA
ncbi:Pex12 amino terminal region-domain-containing protein [Suillus clintonianus]|uniref:Pex12 amino terminal region-domain-containing protein n=1 Tax=Suillus clintonianus TaxID=1904413 RepID=UPI001B87CC2F|nr:Pex12 amino terminal region-domain-containing protein [Suillus clintonianus]KAG2156190.1 Pex12 amino terminal region-domain-containing protein [Suillus clintonianus]